MEGRTAGDDAARMTSPAPLLEAELVELTARTAPGVIRDPESCIVSNAEMWRLLATVRALAALKHTRQFGVSISGSGSVEMSTVELEVCIECEHSIGLHFESVDGKVRCLHTESGVSEKGVIGIPWTRQCDCVDYKSHQRTRDRADEAKRREQVARVRQLLKDGDDA